MYKKLFVLSLFLTVYQFHCIAQNDSIVLFNALKTKEYNQWLSNSNLLKYISCDKAVSDDKGLTIFIKADSWDSLEVAFQKKFSVPLMTYLINKALFCFDSKKEETHFNIEAGKNTVFVDYKNSGFIIEKLEKRGIVNGTLKVTISDIKITNLNRTYSQESLDKVIDKLIIGLDEHYKARAPKFIEKYNFIPDNPQNKSLKIIASNIVDEVLNKGYFETVVINFTFNQIGTKLAIDYTIDGKYASGIVKAPTMSSSWKDIGIDYQSQLNLYVIKMKNTISAILKK